MSPSFEERGKAYFEAKKPYEEALNQHFKERLAYKNSPQSHTGAKQSDSTEQSAPEKTPRSRDIPNEELKSIMEDLEAAKLGDSEKKAQNGKPKDGK